MHFTTTITFLLFAKELRHAEKYADLTGQSFSAVMRGLLDDVPDEGLKDSGAQPTQIIKRKELEHVSFRVSVEQKEVFRKNCERHGVNETFALRYRICALSVEGQLDPIEEPFPLKRNRPRGRISRANHGKGTYDDGAKSFSVRLPMSLERKILLFASVPDFFREAVREKIKVSPKKLQEEEIFGELKTYTVRFPPDLSQFLAGVKAKDFIFTAVLDKLTTAVLEKVEDAKASV
jgi:hypothetical protein